MDAEKTGKLICQLRNNKNLTQKEFAEKLNVTDKAVSVDTIMEGEIKKSGIVAKGVKVSILDWKSIL